MTIHDYIEKINRQFQTGRSTEHSYRSPFQNYIESLLPDALITNEPSRSKVGAPDYIITDKKDIPFAYIETKDIGKNLDSKDYKEQFARYKAGLDILIITDYLEFRLFKRGVQTQVIRIAKVEGNKIVPFEDMFLSHTEGARQFEYMIQSLLNKDGVNITIKSANDLALRMAAKARLFADVIFKALEINDEAFEIADGALSKQYQSFKQILIGDISHKEFADIYAQTVTYGMFAARLHDTTLENFSRQEAAELIPKSNPFLRKLFQYVASHDLDDRIKWIVDDLAEVFRYTDVSAILKDFGRATQQTDPMIHFYETFLAAYDASLRKARGVWYTPEPVVNFIVRAVDEILKTEFGLKEGLADTSKTTVKIKVPTHDKRHKGGMVEAEQSVHRVQLLDPACGTGTFLAETIRHIHKKFKNQTGIWNSYVEEHLIPRLHGFELLMASYAMAHIKMDMLLRETGYTLKQQKRFKIFLTNSLEEHHKDAGTLFWAQWLADEARQADEVKRDAPVMVVLGNPPYSVSSSNKSVWIEKLMQDYKKDLNERNIQPLSDDYIKFIRFGQYFIEKNTEGILAFISNNGFLDGITHRQMRKSLITAFDKIYIIDLHGNSNKKESSPDGSIDQNVFDIQQGVSINLFIKSKNKKDNKCQVFFTEYFGNRESKYKRLLESNLKSIDWIEIDFNNPQVLFTNKSFKESKNYNNGFSINELFSISSTGIKTHRDHFVVDFDEKELQKRLRTFYDKNLSDSQIQNMLELSNNRDWTIKDARIKSSFDHIKIKPLMYRPFDIRKIYYDSNVIDFPKENVMQHMILDNIGLICARSNKTNDISHFFITTFFSEMKTGESTNGSYHFPLYLYSQSNDLFSNQSRTPNLKLEIVEKIAQAIGKRFTPEKEKDKVTFAPIDVLDYIYAVLHTPQYRERYKEFLKIDFPCVPYPKDAAQWEAMVAQGTILRGLHLLESKEVEDYITSFPNDGDNTVGKPRFELSSTHNPESPKGKVWLNVTQCFDNVPEAAWNFYIGGYQPAQKWLKDRVGRKLNFEDIMHYQKMIVALLRTAEIMKKLNKLF